MDLLKDLAKDFQVACRTLARRPAFVLLAGLTLALAIGGNTALFSVIDGVLLRPLPLPEGDRVYALDEQSATGSTGVSAGNFVEWVRRNTAFQNLAAFRNDNFTLTGEGEPERVRGSRVSAAYFDLLRLPPVLGRGLRPEEDQFGAPAVVVLGEGLWQRRFGGQQNILGKPITINGTSYVVVGVMPAETQIPGGGEQLWVPLAFSSDDIKARGRHNLSVLGRLKPGVSPEDAAERMRAITAQLEKEFARYNTGSTFTMAPLLEQIVGTFRPALLILFGAVALLLFNACANVANLLVVRATAREREMAVRSAVGASKLRLAWLAVSDSIAIGILAGLGGLALAAGALALFRRFAPPEIPRLDTIALNGRVLAFTLALSLLTSFACGLASSLIRTRDFGGLLQGGRSARIGRHRLESVLAVFQVALALMLLIGAGLLIRSYARMRAVDVGFDTSNLLTLRLTLPAAKYQEPGRIGQAYQDILAAVRAVPGVKAASAASYVPLTGLTMSSGVNLEGSNPTSAADLPEAQFRVVEPGYFETLRIPLVRGRAFTPVDDDRSPRVALVNETMARRFWSGGNPLGRRVAVDYVGLQPIWIEVVGIVRDIKHFGQGAETKPELYIPAAQAGSTWSWFGRSMTLVVRGDSPLALAGALRDAIWRIDRDLPIQDLATAEILLQRSVQQPRLQMLLLVSFAVLALLLATVGVYGLLSQLVAERRQEIGVRMCLGAHQRDVLTLVIGRGMRLVLGGIVAGVFLAFATTRLLRQLLFGIDTVDSVTFWAVPLFLLLVALFACYWPARRASRMHPTQALVLD